MGPPLFKMPDPKKYLLMTAGPAGSFPAPAGSSVAMTLWHVAENLQSDGNRVHICFLHTEDFFKAEAEFKERIARLKNLGVSADIIPMGSLKYGKLRKLQIFRGVICPRTEDFYPEIFLTPAVMEVLKQFQPDLVYHHGTTTVFITEDKTTAVQVVLLGDLDEEMIYYRWKLTSPWAFSKYVYRGLLWISARKLSRERARVFRKCGQVLINSYRIQPIFKKIGVPCRYIPTPCATNDLGPVCLSAPDVKKAKPKLLMLGHLGGTPTQLGLHFLADHILPHLEKNLGATGFEIHILGRDPLPPHLAKKLQHPSIKLRGYVDNLIAEYAETDVMLCATPVSTGVRTRLAEALSTGCCVVAHRAESGGMPELRHGENVLLGSSGEEIAGAILQAFADRSLRLRLGHGARQTYEKYFSPSVALTGLVQEIKRVAELSHVS